MRSLAVLAFSVIPMLSLGCSAPAGVPEGVGQTAQADECAPLDVDFAGCTEVANVGLVPTANVRPLVPAAFTLVESADPTTTELVVRAVHCDAVSVAGGPAVATDIIQIGAVIVAPLGNGDINNYTLFYDTSNAALAAGLAEQGVPARFVPSLRESVRLNADGTGQFSFDVPAPYEPQLTFDGPVGVRATTFIPFTANWWFTSELGTTEMASNFPQLFTAGNTVVLTAPDHTRLADILGTTTLSAWPVLALYDTAPSAHMVVTVTQ